MVTGFFVSKSLARRDDKAEYFRYIKKYVVRIFWLYVIWWVIYIPNTAVRWSGKNQFASYSGFELYWKLLRSYFLNFFTGSTFTGSWYLSATILGVLILFSFRGGERDFIGGVSMILFVGVLLLGNYGKVLLQGDMLNDWVWIRNHIGNPSQSFLTSVPLLYIGNLSYRFENVFNRIDIRWLIIGLIGSSLMIFKENQLWLRLGGQFENDEMVFGVVFATVLMLIGINSINKAVEVPYSAILRKFSSFMYLSQFGVIIGIRLISNEYQIITNTMTRLYLDLVIILVLFMILHQLSKKFKQIEYLW
ncbi:acyltransferase [Weissella cibaria]|nr:acyltransferase [Weissella cibaria]